MLTVGEPAAPHPANEVGSPAMPEPGDARDGVRRLRLPAAVFGVLGATLAILVPVLPVTYTFADLHWPTAAGTGPVSAPLVGYQPAPPSPAPGDQPKLTGFRRDGLPPANGSDPSAPDWHPPYGLGGDTAPVWGDYHAAGSGPADTLRTSWYQLPEDARAGRAPLVVDLAGHEAAPNSLTAQFGIRTAAGFHVVADQQITQPGGPGWREARLMLPTAAVRADAVLLVATTSTLGLDQWLAVSAPRVPEVTTMTDLIGARPMYLEWTTGLTFPCLQPFSTRDGIPQLPAYRITAGGDLRAVSRDWSAPSAGGPPGWLNVAATEQELPTYLRGDLNRDWGTLYAVAPYVPAAPAAAALHTATQTYSGLWSPGPGSHPVDLPGIPPKTDSRNVINTTS